MLEVDLVEEELFPRVPLRWMSMAGKKRRSASLRSRCNSMLPVPLNSS